jgi:hypothetical protein
MVITEKLIFAQWVNEFFAFYGTRNSLPFPQDPATAPYPEPEGATVTPHNIFL